MNINLENIDREQFYVNEHVLNGEIVYLVFPKQLGVNWTQENKHFRSSLWNAQGELISAGLPKFTNWGEKPEVFPVPTSLDDATVVEKLDGSLLIVSKYKGNYILRTRGTVDAHKLDNSYELEVFERDILPNLNMNQNTFPQSYLFEWLSPVNKIVLNYGDEPLFRLIGVIEHCDYSLVKQSELDMVAPVWNVKRPETYKFSTVSDLLENIEKWSGKEGVCVYSNRGIHKVKSAWYLVLHRMKSELSSLEKVMDVWFERGQPDYNTFYNYISTTFDFEIAEQARGHISNICDAWKQVQQIEAGMKRFLTEQVLTMPTRRLQAVVITQSYGKTNRASFVFTLLDGKPLGDKEYKKLMWQVLKK